VVLSRFNDERREQAMASTAREIMTGGVECVQEHETILEAAKKMADRKTW
jgi:CBS domain-containing protein